MTRLVEFAIVAVTIAVCGLALAIADDKLRRMDLASQEDFHAAPRGIIMREAGL